ncbi:MAG: response regulator [Fibrobacteria bacterium]|nr:response regulator [Fibrobacteria bacterium]
MADSENLNVLLVEDNFGDVLYIHKLLEYSSAKIEHNFEIKTCVCLEEALEVISLEDIRIVLLDLNLPDSKGLETFKRLHRVYPHLPVIILTGINDEHLSFEAVNEGASDYLVKGEIDDEFLMVSLVEALQTNTIGYD